MVCLRHVGSLPVPASPAYIKLNARNARRGIGRGIRRTALLCAFSMLVGTSVGAREYAEGAAKAAFIYRFAGYVEWPARRSDSAVFTIAVLRDDVMAAELEHLLSGRRINDRPAHIRRIRRIDDLRDAEILYVGSRSHEAVRRAVAKVGPRPVLIVTDEERGLDDGSVVNFMVIEQRVRFEISLAAAERRGLRISSELLSVAARVEPGVAQAGH